MSEWCLVTERGTVINMATTHNMTTPKLTEYQMERGYRWVSLSKVSQAALSKYRYWNERP